MNYELAKKLKDAGYPQITFDALFSLKGVYISSVGQVHPRAISVMLESDQCAYVPTLDELIYKCDPVRADDFFIETCPIGWRAFYLYYGFFEHNEKFKKEDGMFEVDQEAFGITPEEAVANLWLKLNDKSVENPL